MTNVKQNKLQWRWVIIPIIILAVIGIANFPKGDRILSEQPVDSSENGLISKENAVVKVKALPEVKDYLKRISNGQVLINGEENNSYMIQVYEYKNNHTATFNWYKVDKTTGDVEKQF